MSTEMPTMKDSQTISLGGSARARPGTFVVVPGGIGWVSQTRGTQP